MTEWSGKSCSGGPNRLQVSVSWTALMIEGASLPALVQVSALLTRLLASRPLTVLDSWGVDPAVRELVRGLHSQLSR